MNAIHPTAVIDGQAVIAPDVRIGAYVVVEGPVRIGAGCVLEAHATVLGHTTLGEGNRVFPGAVIGAEPQDLKYDGAPTRLEIGDGNRFREHTTVHPGTTDGGGVTRIGSRGLFMVGSHVAHDCMVGDDVILANHVLLAGHVVVQDRAILNGASACHHFATVGRLAYVGGLTRVVQDVHPFTIVEGHPARVRGANVVGMRRSGIDEASVARLRRAVYAIFLSEKENTQQAVARLEAEHPGCPLIAELVGSLRRSQCGRQGRGAESMGRAT